MKSIYTPGDRIEGRCEACQKFQPSTFDYGAVEMDGRTIDGVMRAICDVCGAVVAIANQSAHVIGGALGKRGRKIKTTVRLPHELLDFAGRRLVQAGADPERFEVLVFAFVGSLLNDDRRRETMVKRLAAVTDPVLSRPVSESVNLNLGKRLWEQLERLQADAGLKSMSDLVRRLLVVMEGDRRSATELEKLAVLTQ